MKKFEKGMVIDASVARAVGVSEHPVSSRSRQFLETFQKLSTHKIVISPEIREEWDKHQSMWFKRFRRIMITRGRVIRLNSVYDKALREHIATLASGNNLDEILKDTHLLEAAVATDQIVISNDDSMRSRLSKLTTRIGRIRAIVWVNPTREVEMAVDWLFNCTYLDKQRCLGEWELSHYNETAATLRND